MPRIVHCFSLFIFFFLPTYALELTLEEKVGQVMMVHFYGETANEEAKILVQDIGVGGIIYYNWANGLHSPNQVHTLSSGLQKLAKIPLFIAIDQEGGRVTRLKNGFTQFPPNKDLNHPNLAEEAATTMGKELKTVGINLTLAPVVDINSNPKNPVIGNRSFGDNPDRVIAFSKKALQGYKKANIIACIKHFPGHGDVEIDSHKDLPVIYKSFDALKTNELLPFAKLASSAEMIMTGHLLVSAFDSENCTTLSKKTLNYLKEEIGFKGIIITDSLVMEGVLKKYQTIEETAIQALNAGCDILLLGGKQLIDEGSSLELTPVDIRRIHRSIVEAIKEGRVSEERLNQAVKKIIMLKKNSIPIEIY